MSFNLQLSKSENIKAMFSAPNYLYTHERKNISTAFSTCPCFKAYIFRSTTRMQWVCHHLFRSYDRNLSNIANIRLHSVSGHTTILHSYNLGISVSRVSMTFSTLLISKPLSLRISICLSVAMGQ